MSRCEFCNQQLQNLGAQSPLANLSSQCAPCATVIKLLRDSINLPCDSNCNCKTEALQIEEQKSEPLPPPSPPQHKKNDQAVIEKIDHKELAMESQVQRDEIKDNATKALTSFTKMTVTVHCASPSTTMEITTSTGSKEQIVTT
ncbi:hypothetical protein M0802_006298 [Mischocyttarus mexicanus]|nr:hypothetical protein M0802_006298 [Mischocyttarus mexicanus]